MKSLVPIKRVIDHALLTPPVNHNISPLRIPPLKGPEPEGFRATAKPLPFAVLERIQAGKYEVVGPEGLEPPTNPL